jgi:hypothetical protein
MTSSVLDQFIADSAALARTHPELHLTGVGADRSQAVSLHLCGRNMNSSHLYDLAAGTPRQVDMAHNES